jgi:hypothetical protein
MQAACELRLVVPLDERLVLGQQRANPDVGVRLGVGEVVDDHPSRPAAVGRDGVELGRAGVRKRGLDLADPGPVPRDQLRPPLVLHPDIVATPY